MIYWIDIENANGVRLGDGPILTATAWTHTAQLDRAGTFSFSMAADDPRRDLLAVKRIARCWTYDNGLKHLGAGIINDIALRLDAEGAPVLTVSGDDLLHELTYRNVGALELWDTVTAHPATLIYVPNGAAVEAGDDATDSTSLLAAQDNATGDTTTWESLDWMMSIRWTIVKHPRPFKQVTFTLPNFNYLSTAYTLEYWATTDTGEDWQTLSATASHPTPWGATTYTLTWDVPSDWTIRTGESGYKIRFQPEECTNGIKISDCYIVFDQPTTTALAEIIGYAPTGWSLDTANGYASIARATELGPNLIANEGFEDYTGTVDDGNTDTFDHWTNVPVDYGGNDTTRLEAVSAAHSGSVALKLSGAEVYDMPQVYQDITVAAGTDYVFAVYSHGDGTHDGVYRLRTTGEGSLTPILATGNPSTNWQETRVDVTVPPGITNLRVILASAWWLDPGAAWWDSLSLRQRQGGEVYLQFANESVLEALIRVAETTGEHFILSPSGRQVLWLRNDVRSTGVRCVGNVDPQAVEDEPDIALLVNVTESQSAYDLVSRVYPFGGGQGDARATLEHCTRGVPDGYTLDTTNNCLIRTASETAYGRIDRRLDLPDIVALNQSPAQLEYASNMLFDRAYTYLRRHSATSTNVTTGDVPRAYNLTLAKCDRVLLPGYTVRVEYETWYQQTRQLSINRDLWILSSTVRVDEAGIHTVALQCSTTDVAPMTDAMLIADMLRKQRASFAHAPGA